MRLPELLDIAYRLFPPLVGLVSWKYKVPASALYHSLSVAAIAGGVAELLTDDQDEVDLATYGGLVHDYYQKGSSVGLDAKSGEEVLRCVLETSGIEKKIVDAVTNEATRYNIAENPYIWAGRHPVASLSIWLADTIAGTSSALTVESNIQKRVGRLDAKQLNLLQSLHISVVSITIPQVVLRSKIYLEAVKKLGEEGRVVPIVARDGLVVVSNKEVQPMQIDIDEFRLNSSDFDLVYTNARKNAPTLTRKSFDERVRPELFEKNSSSKVPVETAVKSSLVNVDLVNVSWTHDLKYRCAFCGLPVSEPVHPATIGYFLYAKSSMERWSPRVPAVGVNLNRFFRDQWLKSSIVACPLCVLDAAEVWKILNTTGIRAADYFVQMYFPLPTHFELATALSSLLRYMLPLSKEAGQKVSADDVAEAYENPEHYAVFASKLLKLGKDVALLIDSTWALYFNVLSAVNGEFETFAAYAGYLARSILFTGVYPVKFSSKLDPLSERRLLSPVYPLYDVDPADGSSRSRIPLFVALLSIVDSLEDEVSARRGAQLTRDDRVRAVMEYLRYPSSMGTTLLLRHQAGRRVLEVYKMFRESPAGYLVQACRR